MAEWRAVVACGLAAVLALGGLTGCASAEAVVATSPGMPQPGQVAPDFTADAVDGSQVSLAGFRGHPVWLTFGATWCAQCRAEAPDIQAAYERARPSGAVVVAVYLEEDAAAVRTYTERVGMTFVHVPDPKAVVSSLYRVQGVPYHVFIGPDGVIDSVQFGILSREQMDAALAAAA